MAGELSYVEREDGKWGLPGSVEGVEQVDHRGDVVLAMEADEESEISVSSGVL